MDGMRRHGAPWVAALLLAAGCGDEGKSALPSGGVPLPRDESFPGQPSDPARFADLFAITPYGTAACDDVAPDLRQRRAVRLFHHPSVRNLPDYTRGLARYYHRYGVSFYTEHAPIEVPLDWVVDLDEDRIVEHLREAFPGLDPQAQPSEAELEAITREAFSYIFQGMLRFAATYGAEGEEVTNVVIVPQVSRGDSSPYDDARVAGLAMSPVLIEELGHAADSMEAAFWRDFPIQGSFTPMAFISVDVTSAHPLAPDLVTAHEVGHTFGLMHVTPTFNLMTPQLEDGLNVACTQALEMAQLDRVARTLAEPEARVAAPREPAAARWTRLRAWLWEGGPRPFRAIE